MARVIFWVLLILAILFRISLASAITSPSLIRYDFDLPNTCLFERFNRCLQSFLDVVAIFSFGIHFINQFSMLVFHVFQESILKRNYLFDRNIVQIAFIHGIERNGHLSYGHWRILLL